MLYSRKGPCGTGSLVEVGISDRLKESEIEMDSDKELTVYEGGRI